MSRPPKVGDTYLLPLASTSDGRLAKNHIATVTRVEPLGCLCTRLSTTRPGPAAGGLSVLMHLIVDRCGFHQANSPDGTDEPQRVNHEAEVGA